MSSRKLDSYEKEQLIHQQLLGDRTPVVTSIDNLSTLALLKKIEALAEDKTDDMSGIAASEIKYIRAGARALKLNVTLRNKFGQNLAGAIQIGDLIKKRRSQVAFDKMIDMDMGDLFRDDDNYIGQLSARPSAVEQS